MISSFRQLLVCSLFLVLIPQTNFQAQNTKLDSLLSLLKTAKEDSNKVKIMNGAAFELRNSDPARSMQYSEESMKLAGAIDFEKGRGEAYVNIAVVQINFGNYDKALENANTGLPITQKHLDRFNEGRAYNTIGEAYRYKDNYREALKYYEIALKIRKSLGDNKGVANVINNIGIIQFNLGNYPEAIKTHLEALRIREGNKDPEGIAASLNNIALVYLKQLNFEEAIRFNERALEIRTKQKDKKGMASSNTNIANILRVKDQTKKALEKYFIALDLFKEIGDRKNIAGSYNNIGSTYQVEGDTLLVHGRRSEAEAKIRESLIWFEKANEGYKEIESISGAILMAENIGTSNRMIGNYAKAKAYYLKGLANSVKIGSKEDEKNFYYSLSIVDSLSGDYKNAFRHYRHYVATKEELINEENTKKTVQQEMQYSFDKKEIEAKAEQDKKDAVAASDRKRQQVFLVLTAGVLLLVIIFSAYVLRSLRVTRKQKEIIEEQKHLVEEKQKEILDSIHYAKRIQRALMPTERYIDKTLRVLNI